MQQDLTARIEYSDKYYDEQFEYRHVILPKEMLDRFPTGKILSEDEWRALGVQQSRGWEHYAVHKPEPHVLLFKRAHGTNPMSGSVDKAEAEAQRRRYINGELD